MKVGGLSTEAALTLKRQIRNLRKMIDELPGDLPDAELRLEHLKRHLARAHKKLCGLDRENWGEGVSNGRTDHRDR